MKFGICIFDINNQPITQEFDSEWTVCVHDKILLKDKIHRDLVFEEASELICDWIKAELKPEIFKQLLLKLEKQNENDFCSTVSN